MIAPADLLPYSDSTSDPRDLTPALAHIYFLRGVPAPEGNFYFPHLADVGVEPQCSEVGSGFFFKDKATHSYSPVTSGIDTHLKEGKYALTRLEPKEFWLVVCLGMSNFVGINAAPHALEAIFSEGGMWIGKAFITALNWYAVGFFAVPTVRACVYATLNWFVEKRNKVRGSFN